MPNKPETEILKAVLSNNTCPAGIKFPIYYEENGVLIREEQDGTKYKIKLDKNNKEQIIEKL